MALITAADIPYINFQDLSADPSGDPSAGFAFIFVKNGNVFVEIDDGTVTQLGGSSVGALNDLTDVVIGGVSTGNVLAYNGSNWVNLAAGTDGQVLTVDSGQAEGVSWQTSSTATDEDARVLLYLGVGGTGAS